MRLKRTIKPCLLIRKNAIRAIPYIYVEHNVFGVYYEVLLVHNTSNVGSITTPFHKNNGDVWKSFRTDTF